VKLTIGDHGYQVQKAVTLYTDMSQNVLALQQLLGSPESAAPLPGIQRDGIYPEIAGWRLVAAPLSYATVGQPSERSVYIASVDPALPGGTKSLGVFESANAQSYQEGQ
jgi:hypothetical protein